MGLECDFRMKTDLSIDGQIWLDTKSGFWRERDIPLLTFPYEWKELPRI